MKTTKYVVEFGINIFYCGSMMTDKFEVTNKLTKAYSFTDLKFAQECASEYGGRVRVLTLTYELGDEV